MKILLTALIILAAAVGCDKKEVIKEVPKQQECTAEYSEGIGLDGKYWFVLEGYWVRCQGHIGVSRPHCEWKR